jgi:hypothetical protein
MKNQVIVQTAYDIEKDVDQFRLTVMWDDVVYGVLFSDKDTKQQLSEKFQSFANKLKES